MDIIIAGDYYPNRRVKKMIESDDNAYIISDDIRRIIQESDVAIVNYESPISEGDDNEPIKKQGPCLRSSRKSANYIYKAGFNVATLANNHIKDYGEDALIETVAYLRQIGMATVGVGKNKEEAAESLIIEKHNKKVAIINCCEKEFSIASENTAGANSLDPVRQYYKIREARRQSDYVIVIVHGGSEGYQLPREQMVDNYRFFIDVGADVVVNHHQHCYSGYEQYKEGLIFYGLGNFCFDGFDGTESKIWNEGYMLKLQLNTSGHTFELIPYTQCATSPTVELLKASEKGNFTSHLTHLNHIIANRDLLREENCKWMRTTESSYLAMASPYQDRYLLGAYKHKLLPSCISKQKARALLNIVRCDSHRERLINALERITKNK